MKYPDEYKNKLSKIHKKNYKLGREIPWNKGLTKETDKRIRKYSIKCSERQKEKYDKHPEIKEQISNSVKKLWKSSLYRKHMINKIINREINPRCGSGMGGLRKDIGHPVRSTWEANVCRILQFLNIEYDYEPEKFVFEKEEMTYTPDFYIPDWDIYWEIKGYMNEKSKEKIKLFRKYHPDKTLDIIGKYSYKALIDEYKYRILGLEHDGILR